MNYMDRIPEGIPDFFERSIYCRRDGESSHKEEIMD